MTNEQKQYVRDNYQNKTNKELAQSLGVNISKVQGYVLRNLGGRRRPLVSSEIGEYIANNYLVMTYAEIGAKIGLTSDQVKGWVQNHVKDRKSKLREFNSHYFDVIDTPRKAYWLGFIYADGWITKYRSHPGRNNYEFGMELQRSDRYILEELNKDLGGVHAIKDLENTNSNKLGTQKADKTFSSALRVYSKDIVNGLLSNGIDLRKTVSDVFPKVSEDMFPAFLRGYIDGDGCIHKMKANRLAVHITGANLKAMEYLRDVLISRYGIHANIYSEEFDKYRTKYRLYCFRDKDVRTLLDLIYSDKDVPFLIRKRDRYLNFYGLAA